MGTTISELVRTAARERYLCNLEERQAAMEALVGFRERRREFDDSEGYVRRLRRGGRLDRMEKEMSVLVDSDILIEVTSRQGR